MYSASRLAIAWALILALIVLFVLPDSASAYFDPGTGSLIWQLLLAGALTAAYLIKRYWRKIRHLLHIGQAAKPEEDGEDPGE
jgi:hypothetical protein